MIKSNTKVILVVDDDPIVKRFIGDIAKKVFGYVTIGVSTYKDAIDVSQTRKPGLIFFDENLADGTGKQFCIEMSKKPELRSIHKWLVTGAKPLSWDTEEWSSFGVRGCLVKPVGVNLLISTIRDAVCPKK